MNKGRKEYKFLWFIENYSYCWHKNGEILRSPVFTIDGLEGTAWYLMLYPRGYKVENRDRISLFLARFAKKKDAGPKFFSVKYELSLLGMDGSTISIGDFEYTVEAGIGRGSCRLVQTDDILLRRKAEYLPKDTLSVCCKMWKGKGAARNVGQISARTRILTENYSFLHVVENFSALQPNINQTINIHSYSKKGRVISCSLCFISGTYCEGNIMIEIVPSDDENILQKCDLSLLDRSRNIIECGGVDYRYGVARTSLHKLPLSLTREVILNRKSEYLPNNRLSLLCECTFSTRSVSATIEEVLHELPLPVMKQKNNHVHSNDEYKTAEKLSQYPSATEDMKAIYLNQYLSDVKLKTKTKSFPAHKNVLCARSDVFKAMITRNIKEKNADCIQVEDLENDTVEKLLLFLYSDNLEISQWKSSSQLYYAAAKYQIGKLKAMCSSYLAKYITISNVSELLVLADTHKDSNLKKVAEDFILKHEDRIFCSSTWEKMIEKHPLLVIKTMQLKYKRKKEAN
ncbi:Speckle-type POZ protein [Araneus ventricosus]|uniref:Speckle-type POZ protein n=1 Tax=Araneus ventricosus TaxID=182803 RepID=A0A4Y2CH79_ARAVE|nr:Speckle-type POZ protein [Araneus ventricosus]